MAGWEAYIHADAPDRLVQLAIVHAEFESIHPFLDGNGRIGRLIIPLFLYAHGLLSRPNFYLSEYLEANRDEYYDRMLAVSRDDDWSGWLAFFLRGIVSVSREATETARRILTLREDHRAAVTAHLGRAAGNGHRVLESLYQRPIVSVAEVQALTGTTYTAANSLVSRLAQLEILQEATGYKRNRVFRYQPYIAIFGENESEMPVGT